MTDDHTITTTAPAKIQRQYRQTEIHPLAAAAMSADIDTDRLEKLMELQERHEANEAKKAFTDSMVRLKADMPSVLNKDSVVDFTSSKGRTRYRFTTLAHAINIVSPHLSAHGFSISWAPVNDDKTVTVTCRITHADGHHEETKMTAPHDIGAGKNAVQAIGSTTTYLQRYTALSILGIATADMKEPTGPTDESVNASHNLRAVSGLEKCGISLADAEKHVQRDVKQWTNLDLEKLRELAKAKKEEEKQE